MWGVAETLLDAVGSCRVHWDTCHGDRQVTPWRLPLRTAGKCYQEGGDCRSPIHPGDRLSPVPTT